MRLKPMVWLTLGSAALALGAVKGADLTRQIQELAKMTPAEFEASATIKDDGLETAAMITTQNGWQLHDGLLGVVNDDAYFRAFIDKRTGATRYEVYHTTHYVAPRRVSFDTVNFETARGPVTAPLTPIARTRDGCRSPSGCPYFEIVGFDVDETLLRTLAAQYVPGHIATWKYRLKGRLGVERNAFFAVAEIAGILAAVDRYRAAHRLPGATTAQ